jgi:hypothetical protein
VDKNRIKCSGVSRMFGKLSIWLVLLWLTILFLPPAESLAVTPPDLLGTWTGTVNKVTPDGFFTETIILRILQQWDTFIKGDIVVDGVTIDFVSKIDNIDPTTYNASLDFYAIKLDWSFLIDCQASYINNPTQIVLSSIGKYELGPDFPYNVAPDNIEYDDCTLLRQ